MPTRKGGVVVRFMECHGRKFKLSSGSQASLPLCLGNTLEDKGIGGKVGHGLKWQVFLLPYHS